MKDRKSEVVARFPTPIWIGVVENNEDINNSLLSYIKNIKEKNPQGVHRSNILGWHSSDLDLQNDNIKNFWLVSDYIWDHIKDTELFYY